MKERESEKEREEQSVQLAHQRLKDSLILSSSVYRRVNNFRHRRKKVPPSRVRFNDSYAVSSPPSSAFHSTRGEPRELERCFGAGCLDLMRSTVNRARERRSCGMKRGASPRVSNNFTTRNARAIRQKGNRFCSIAQTVGRSARARASICFFSFFSFFSSTLGVVLTPPPPPAPPPCVGVFTHSRTLRCDTMRKRDSSRQKENV